MISLCIGPKNMNANKEFMSSGPRSAFVNCMTMRKLLNFSEFGSHLPSPVDYCEDQQEHGLRVFQGHGRYWIQAGTEESSGHGEE